MTPEIRKNLEYLVDLSDNAMTDANTFYRLKKELEMINVAEFSPADWELYHKVFN